MTDLLPCPFCGGNSRQMTWAPGAISISCIICGAHFNADTMAEAIAAWNTRTERTCHMETEESCQNWMSCSECGADYYNDQPVNYCPNCGAKVVE